MNIYNSIRDKFQDSSFNHAKKTSIIRAFFTEQYNKSSVQQFYIDLLESYQSNNDNNLENLKEIVNNFPLGILEDISQQDEGWKQFIQELPNFFEKLLYKLEFAYQIEKVLGEVIRGVDDDQYFKNMIQFELEQNESPQRIISYLTISLSILKNLYIEPCNKFFNNLLVIKQNLMNYTSTQKIYISRLIIMNLYMATTKQTQIKLIKNNLQQLVQFCTDVINDIVLENLLNQHSLNHSLVDKTVRSVIKFILSLKDVTSKKLKKKKAEQDQNIDKNKLLIYSIEIVKLINTIVTHPQNYLSVKTLTQFVFFYGFCLSTYNKLENKQINFPLENTENVIFNELVLKYCILSEEEKKLIENDQAGFIDQHSIDYSSSQYSVLRIELCYILQQYFEEKNSESKTQIIMKQLQKIQMNFPDANLFDPSKEYIIESCIYLIYYLTTNCGQSDYISNTIIFPQRGAFVSLLKNCNKFTKSNIYMLLFQMMEDIDSFQQQQCSEFFSYLIQQLKIEQSFIVRNVFNMLYESIDNAWIYQQIQAHISDISLIFKEEFNQGFYQDIKLLAKLQNILGDDAQELNDLALVTVAKQIKNIYQTELDLIQQENQDESEAPLKYKYELTDEFRRNQGDLAVIIQNFKKMKVHDKQIEFFLKEFNQFLEYNNQNNQVWIYNIHQILSILLSKIYENAHIPQTVQLIYQNFKLFPTESPKIIAKLLKQVVWVQFKTNYMTFCSIEGEYLYKQTINIIQNFKDKINFNQQKSYAFNFMITFLIISELLYEQILDCQSECYELLEQYLECITANQLKLILLCIQSVIFYKQDDPTYSLITTEQSCLEYIESMNNMEFTNLPLCIIKRYFLGMSKILFVVHDQDGLQKFSIVFKNLYDRYAQLSQVENLSNQENDDQGSDDQWESASEIYEDQAEEEEEEEDAEAEAEEEQNSSENESEESIVEGQEDEVGLNNNNVNLQNAESSKTDEFFKKEGFIGEIISNRLPLDFVNFIKEIGKGLLHQKQNNEDGYNTIVEQFSDNKSTDFILECEKHGEQSEFNSSIYED